MSKAKGRRYEKRAQRILEDAGYAVTCAAASLGCFDLVAVGPKGVRLIQVKGGVDARLRPHERETIQMLTVPSCCCTKEYWRFRQHARGGPEIEVIG